MIYFDISIYFKCFFSNVSFAAGVINLKKGHFITKMTLMEVGKHVNDFFVELFLVVSLIVGTWQALVDGNVM